MKLTYFGHSAYQIELESTTILVDPFITGNPQAEGIVEAADLNPDVIILTHAHGDHWGDTPAIAARTGAMVIGTFEIAQYIQTQHGHNHTHPMNTGGAATFKWGSVKLTYARHSSSFPDGSYGGTANGILLHADGKTIYNTGDTCPFSEMAWIGEANDVDVCLMPIGDNFTMGPDDSIRAAGMIQPKLIIPMHYNTFPYIEIDVASWENKMAEAGFSNQVLQPGGTLEI